MNWKCEHCGHENDGSLNKCMCGFERTGESVVGSKTDKNDMVPVETYANGIGRSSDEVIQLIKEQKIVGSLLVDKWFVDVLATTRLHPNEQSDKDAAAVYHTRTSADVQPNPIGLFISKTVINAGILAAIFTLAGIFFNNRSLPFMLSSVIKNIPFLLVLGVAITIFQMIDKFRESRNKMQK